MTWYWHIHHGELVETTMGINRRKAYIRGEKPPEEVALRLALIKKIKNQALMSQLMTAMPDREKREAILALHNKECKDCPWHSRRAGSIFGTIFTHRSTQSPHDFVRPSQGPRSKARY